MKKATFVAELNQLYPILTWVIQEIAPFNPSTEWVHQMELALEEALVNVIHYAYPSVSKGKIEISVEKQAEGVVVSLKDYGAPFNPLKHPFSGSIDKEGGFGILFMKQMVDEITYLYEEANLLRLVKKL